VVAFPRSESLDALAAREVNRYALWLVLVFGTVVTALVLAARSVNRELTLSRLRAEFVASVSHELKTPLSLIRMFAESLREGWVAEPHKMDYYEVITRESERLTGLINNVLDFSRLESGTRQYQLGTIDLGQLVENLLGRYEFHLRAASIDLVLRLPVEAVYARADRDAIEQVIVNLLSNAVKYMGDPSRRPRQVQVSLERSDDHLVLRVSDTGIGMSDAHRTHIFERFYRADDEQVRAVAGSGLGLTLVKAHIDAHAGTIAVDSVPGQGSTFAISLPLATGGAES
jgi:signal transduction histidine kinase